MERAPRVLSVGFTVDEAEADILKRQRRLIEDIRLAVSRCDKVYPEPEPERKNPVTGHSMQCHCDDCIDADEGVAINWKPKERERVLAEIELKKRRLIAGEREYDANMAKLARVDRFALDRPAYSAPAGFHRSEDGPQWMALCCRRCS